MSSYLIPKSAYDYGLVILVLIMVIPWSSSCGTLFRNMSSNVFYGLFSLMLLSTIFCLSLVFGLLLLSTGVRSRLEYAIIIAIGLESYWRLA